MYAAVQRLVRTLVKETVSPVGLDSVIGCFGKTSTKALKSNMIDTTKDTVRLLYRMPRQILHTHVAKKNFVRGPFTAPVRARLFAP